MKIVDIAGIIILAGIGYVIYKHAPIHHVLPNLEHAEDGAMGDEVHPDVYELASGGPPNRRNDKQFDIPGQMLHSDGYVY